MTHSSAALLLAVSLTALGLCLSGCGGGEETAGDSDSSGGSSSASGGSSGGNGTGGEIVSGVGGALVDDYMSDAFSLEESGGTFTLEHGDATMIVTPDQGGRILSFTVLGSETLVQEGEAAEHGSTFWPSPQNWGWPPATNIAEIDPNPYVASTSPQRLILTSDNNSFLGVTVTKTFGPAESQAGVLGFAVTYTIENTSAVQLTYAGWEISRAASGVVFYPEGPGGVLEKSSLTAQSALGHGWYTYDATGLEGVPKIFADGSDGWLAWAAEDDFGAGTLVVKAFEDIPVSSFATGEAEIEIYADPSGEYMEVEQQGPADLLQPGDMLSFRVEWYGASVPATVTIEDGSQALVDLVTATLGTR